MPWSEHDYPDSLKNLDPIVRRKAIDIANAMLAEGYEDDAAIPIATAQAKKWAEDADAAEKRALKRKDITDHPRQPKSRGAKLIERDVTVNKVEDGWEVRTVGAQRADSLHKTKREATARAQEIAEKRGTDVQT